MIAALPSTTPTTGPTTTERRLRATALITARATVTGPTVGNSLSTSVDFRSALSAPLKPVRTAGGWIAATCTPAPRNSLSSATLRLVTKALLAA